ncbi:hypothetical protein [Aliiruegeria lutimaris]|uniref:Uncharacterized protein n=1 Tax=Aliiruegeria lutimaris TaxID=571298 RepID=A0A1G9C8N1_9RHOB|nr:hypothetical protein [Aliiruegeria lutimaris]SDK48028.1 hypothetical protein SAMN04488026_104236 [Aliiruegeria lutimaris]
MLVFLAALPVTEDSGENEPLLSNRKSRLARGFETERDWRRYVAEEEE